ncbi:MAG: AAA family ATPase [Rubrivivax sp.]|nr:AAA family ATPase [Rubrivivax sp.]
MDLEPFPAKLECSEQLDAQNTVLLRSYWDVSDSAAAIQQVRELADEAWNTQEIPSDPIVTGSRNADWDLLWDTLVRKTGIPRGKFNREQFDTALPANFVLMKRGASHPASMHTSIPLLFVSYAAKVHHLKQDGGSDEAAAAQLGALPWESVNLVLQQAGLRYRMVAPIVKKGSWTQNFELNYRLELEHLQSGAVVPASALSSGERVVFLTSIWSYFFNQAALNSRTALLLLDEPDAHLHPALTKTFLRVIRDELVERRGIRVIATTHSPSTVALTERENLFVMCTAEPRIRPVANKWEPVAHLTAGLVTVGTQTKVVFVEDRDDVEFYQVVQAVLAQDSALSVGFDSARALNFVPASEGRQSGGKQMVIRWVTAIESTQVAGIVDRDDDAEPGGRVHVVARRHLESYLLDPLFIYALLLDENQADRPNFAPSVDHRHSRSLLQLNADVLQQIADGMIEIYAELSGAGGGELVRVSYVGGSVISLPQWVLQCDMKKLFEPLRRRLGTKWSLQHLTRKYEVLAIVPAELAEVLVGIQRA